MIGLRVRISLRFILKYQLQAPAITAVLIARWILWNIGPGS